jgi:predicted metal-dependent phosphoesterase TrpH
LAEAEAAGARLGVEIIPGVELSSGGGGNETHVLGYFIDRHSSQLIAALAEFAAQRRIRIERIVQRLGAIGAPVDLDRVLAFAGAGTAGRPHVARALIEAGYATSIGDAFERYLAFGRPGFVPRHRLVAEDAVSIIAGAGGVPVLAHPLTTGDVEGTLARLVPAGLRGLETFYGEYEPDTRESLRLTADRWSLIPTGGSDYHGPAFKPGRDLGGAYVPMESVERLRDAAHPRLGAAERPAPGVVRP